MGASCSQQLEARNSQQPWIALDAKFRGPSTYVHPSTLVVCWFKRYDVAVLKTTPATSITNFEQKSRWYPTRQASSLFLRSKGRPRTTKKREKNKIIDLIMVGLFHLPALLLSVYIPNSLECVVRVRFVMEYSVTAEPASCLLSPIAVSSGVGERHMQQQKASQNQECGKAANDRRAAAVS